MKAAVATQGELSPVVGGRWHTLLAIDLDKWAARTYAANFPDVEVRCASVADEIDRLPDCDVILGGPPCQPHSFAGKRKASNDSRDCGPDFAAAVARKRPRMFLMENVAGLMSSEGGAYAARLLSSLEAAGYVVQIRLLDAVDYGVPQFRSRCWWWGVRQDLFAAGIRHRWPHATHAWPPPQSAMLFGESLLPGVTVGQALGLDGWFDGQNDTAHGPDEPCGTIQGNAQAKGGRAGHFAIRKPRSAKVVRRDHPVSEPCPTIEARAALGGGSCMRLVARVMGGGRNHPADADGNYRRDERDITDEPATTMAGFSGAWEGGTLPRLQIVGADALPDLSDLVISQAQVDRMAEYERKSGCVNSRELRPGEPSRTVTAKNAQGTTSDALRVQWRQKDGLWIRRLTPLECARLQSVPDCFIWPESISKTATYKIVGNGWASGMAAAMSRSLAATDPDSQTVVDLFCGGGLGAVGWHGRYWSHTPQAAEVA